MSNLVEDSICASVGNIEEWSYQAPLDLLLQSFLRADGAGGPGGAFRVGVDLLAVSYVRVMLVLFEER